VYLLTDSKGKSRYVKQTSQNTERPDLGNARIVVTGGRGLKNAENFKMIEKLAEKLGAAGTFYISEEFLFLHLGPISICYCCKYDPVSLSLSLSLSLS
jgi:hypothetical protein